MSNFMQRYNSTKNKHSKKRWLNLGKLEWYVSASNHIFATCFVLNIVVPLIQTTQDSSMFLSSPTGGNQWTKCHSFFLLALMTLEIKKVATDLCVFPSQVLVLKTFFSIKICFRQCGIQPYIAFIFRVTGRGIVYFDQKDYEDDVLSFKK